MSHVARINESCRAYEIPDSHTWWGMSHVWMSHGTHIMRRVTRMNESWHTYDWACRAYEWVMTHVTHVMRRVTRMNEACHTYTWVISHVWMSCIAHVMRRVTRMNESCHTCAWVVSHTWWSVSHVWMRHVTHMHESCHTCEWVMSHMWMRHLTRITHMMRHVDGVGYMYMHMYIHIYVHTCTNVYIHLYVHVGFISLAASTLSLYVYNLHVFYIREYMYTYMDMYLWGMICLQSQLWVCCM